MTITLFLLALATTLCLGAYLGAKATATWGRDAVCDEAERADGEL